MLGTQIVFGQISWSSECTHQVSWKSEGGRPFFVLTWPGITHNYLPYLTSKDPALVSPSYYLHPGTTCTYTYIYSIIHM